jgi:purine-cytosine permease-like protein
MLVVAGVIFTIACLSGRVPATEHAATGAGAPLRGFDVVFGYQTSWLLMFGDYSRYTRSGRGAAIAVFAGLGLTALWFIPLGLYSSLIAGSSDPGVMVTTLRLGMWGGVLVVLATLTTNFVNIYMSALALKSLRPSIADRSAICIIGGIGAAISALSSTWLDQMANFTVLLAGVFVPVGGVLLAHYALGAYMPSVRTAAAARDGRPFHGADTAALYHGARGEPPAVGMWRVPGLTAWAAGAIVYYLGQTVGGTLPSLFVSICAYLVMSRRSSVS